MKNHIRGEGLASIQKTLKEWNLSNISDKELLYLIVGRKGGKTTIRILDKILMKPYNKNQLANQLNLDYNTITHHIKIIESYDYITEVRFENIYYYQPSEKLFKSIDEYNIIKESMQNDESEE